MSSTDSFINLEFALCRSITMLYNVTKWNTFRHAVRNLFTSFMTLKKWAAIKKRSISVDVCGNRGRGLTIASRTILVGLTRSLIIVQLVFSLREIRKSTTCFHDVDLRRRSSSFAFSPNERPRTFVTHHCAS